jgi:hypothetical protein
MKNFGVLNRVWRENYDQHQKVFKIVANLVNIMNVNQFEE